MRYGPESERLLREYGEIKWCPPEGSKIVEFYKNKNVLVTGATGFLGKLLVEKLLRACPDINAVYILVRPKKGEDEHTRIDNLYNDEIFSPLMKIFPKFKHKINVIKGDIALVDLGLDPSARTTLTQQVNVIFHIAATVRFDEKINLATAINVRGTRDLVRIAKQCRNLEAFVHISTAYTNCNQREIGEVFYKPPISAEQLIEMMETTPEKEMLRKTDELNGTWPNTYTFTKAVAEDAVIEYGKNLPVCIVRPAIVIATYKEPLRSWIDNLYGATGILMGAGTGLLKTIHCDKNKSAEVVPADYVINCMITASYKTAMDKKLEEVPIYNYVSSAENRLDWKNFMKLNKQWGIEIPTIKCVWYYCLILNKYYLVHCLCNIFLHFVPAYLMDLGMILTRQKPIMVKIYKKIDKFESVIAIFATKQWKFYNGNTQALWNYLSEVDKEIFPFSMKELDWEDYHKTHLFGLRRYLLKDEPSTLPQARKRWRRFYIAHQTIKIAFRILILYMLYKIFLIIFQ